MCHIQTFHIVCSHRAPELIMCEEAKQQDRSRYCLDPTQSFKPKSSSTWYADCKRLVNNDIGLVVDMTGTVPKDSISWNDDRKKFLVPVDGVQFVSVTFT